MFRNIIFYVLINGLVGFVYLKAQPVEDCVNIGCPSQDCSETWCIPLYEPICATNGSDIQTFPRCCDMIYANCAQGNWTKLYDGECGSCIRER